MPRLLSSMTDLQRAAAEAEEAKPTLSLEELAARAAEKAAAKKKQREKYSKRSSQG